MRMDELTVVPSHESAVVGRLDVRNAAVTVIVAGAVVFLLREGVALFAPVLVSVLLAYALQPFVAALTRCRLPRPVATIVVYVLLAVRFARMVRLAQRPGIDFPNDLPPTVPALRPSMQRQDTPSDGPGAIGHLQSAAHD